MLNHWSTDHHWHLWTKILIASALPASLTSATSPFITSLHFCEALQSQPFSLHLPDDCRCSHPTCSLNICFTRPYHYFTKLFLLAFEVFALAASYKPWDINNMTGRKKLQLSEPQLPVTKGHLCQMSNQKNPSVARLHPCSILLEYHQFSYRVRYWFN